MSDRAAVSGSGGGRTMMSCGVCTSGVTFYVRSERLCRNVTFNSAIWTAADNDHDDRAKTFPGTLACAAEELSVDRTR